MSELSLFDESDHASHPSSPKQLLLRRCDVNYAVRLNERWHSRVPIIDASNVTRNRYYCCFVADFETCPYATAIWSSPIAANRLTNGQLLLELRRMAICDDAPRNTASWMIAGMTRHIKQFFPEVVRLISYQDTGSHLGTIYKASNWVQRSTATLTDWTNRDRNQPQTTAPKIRWEYQLRPEPDPVQQRVKPKQDTLDICATPI